MAPPPPPPPPAGGGMWLWPPAAPPALPRERGRGISVVALDDPDYPARLRQIHDPPARLYVNGRLPPEPMIAIVGSRHATPYGRRTPHCLARDLSDAGVVVVSGLARG